ncbi:hypothetical protein [Bradyrhizobium liaoningense]|uniref:hypothetical protein n=1 Tax=Bradyrhizobium liaoningense TaxID=43992 RepID=UPI00289D9E02|nr:hypothetical protein [Bradyrhizobium liaoningense]
MGRLGGLAGGVNGIGRLVGGGHGLGQGLGVRFRRLSCEGLGSEGLSLLRLSNGLGRDHGFGADGCNRRRRLVGMMMFVMIVLAIMAMVVVVVMMIIVMGVMMVVGPMLVMIVLVMIMFVMIMSFVLAVMLEIGVQSVLGQRLSLDRLGAGLEAFDDVAAHAFAMTAAAGVAVARAAAAVGAVLALFLGFAMGLFFGLDQRLPVGDRDLIVVGMDFTEGEEAVAVAAIFDKSGLERGFDPGDLGEVDISAQLLALRGLEIKLFDAIAADHDDPGLFRVGGIDQHLVGHVLTLGGGGRDSPWARIAPPGDATVHLIRG